MPVVLPSNQIGEAGIDDLIDQKRVRQMAHGPREADDERHAEKLAPAVAP